MAQIPEVNPAPPLLVVLSGPSGVGKDAAIAELKNRCFLFASINTLAGVYTSSTHSAIHSKLGLLDVEVDVASLLTCIAATAGGIFALFPYHMERLLVLKSSLDQSIGTGIMAKGVLQNMRVIHKEAKNG